MCSVGPLRSQSTDRFAAAWGPARRNTGGVRRLPTGYSSGKERVHSKYPQQHCCALTRGVSHTQQVPNAGSGRLPNLLLSWLTLMSGLERPSLAQKHGGSQSWTLTLQPSVTHLPTCAACANSEAGICLPPGEHFCLLLPRNHLPVLSLACLLPGHHPLAWVPLTTTSRWR